MGRVKKVFYSLLFPKTAIVILSVPVSAGLLLYTFLVAGEDIPFKLRVSLNLSLGVNLLYAIVNALSGIYYHSVWFGTLAAYYIFLAVMRFLLVRYAHKNGFGENRAAEQKRYRACGISHLFDGLIYILYHSYGGD